MERLGIAPGLQFNLKYLSNPVYDYLILAGQSPRKYIDIATSKQPRLTVLEVEEQFATNLAVRKAGSKGGSNCSCCCSCHDCAITGWQYRGKGDGGQCLVEQIYCCFWTLPYIHGSDNKASGVPLLFVKYTDAAGTSGSIRAEQVIKSMGETPQEEERRKNLETAAALTSDMHAVTSPADVQMTRLDNDREKILAPDQEEATKTKLHGRNSWGGSKKSSIKRRSSFETVESMFCTNCGAKKNSPEQKFCGACGSRFF